MNQHSRLCTILFLASASFSPLVSLQRTYPLIAKIAKPYINKALYPASNLTKPASLNKSPLPIILKGPCMGQETPLSDEVYFYKPQVIETPKNPHEQLFWLAKRGDIDKLMAFWKQVPDPERQVLVAATNEAGNTAFMCAVAYRNLEATQFLFTAGSDRFAKNHAGKRAMDIALENEDLHMMLLLIQK